MYTTDDNQTLFNSNAFAGSIRNIYTGQMPGMKLLIIFDSEQTCSYLDLQVYSFRKFSVLEYWWHHLCLQSNKGLNEKTCLFYNANINDADQPANPRSLISAFVVLCLDRIIPILAIAKILRL